MAAIQLASRLRRHASSYVAEISSVRRTPGAAVPAPLTSFVGRARELATLLALSREGARLITLFGTAGVGKTRLALEWARHPEVAERFSGGVILCDLSEAASGDDVAFLVGASLGLTATHPGAPELAAALAARGPCVLVLDTFEHLIGEAPVTVSAWLRAAPDLAVVATSRSPLGLEGETVCEVGPIGLSDGGDPRRSEAFALFLERARAVRPGYAPVEADATAIGEIVTRLDGLPLAIELAAACMRALTPRQIAAELAHRFELLVAGGADRPARHASLASAIDWSWDLLDETSRAALAQLSVFDGGFDLESAQQVLGVDARRALRLVIGLVQRSLVVAYEERIGASRMRYRLYESVRCYAAERLKERELSLAELDARDAPRSEPPPSLRAMLPPPPSSRSSVRGCLRVAASGRSFRLPGGPRVDLSTRGPLRRILAALADAHARTPDQALSRDALVAAGWPGERLGVEAAANRVYAAIATLRRMGLRAELVRRDDGYLLDPALRVERAED
jgi:predicted ATPase